MEVEFGMLGFYFWLCPLPKNHLLGLSCVWLIVPYFKRAKRNNLPTADCCEKCGATLPQLTAALGLSVVDCSALLRWEPKRLLLAVSLAPLVLAFFGHIRALLYFKSWKMSPLRLFCGLLVGQLWAVKGWMVLNSGSHPAESWHHAPVPPEQHKESRLLYDRMTGDCHSSCGLCCLLSSSFKLSLTWCWKLSRYTRSHPGTLRKTFLFHFFLGRRI